MGTFFCPIGVSISHCMKGKFNVDTKNTKPAHTSIHFKEAWDIKQCEKIIVLLLSRSVCLDSAHIKNVAIRTIGPFISNGGRLDLKVYVCEREFSCNFQIFENIFRYFVLVSCVHRLRAQEIFNP